MNHKIKVVALYGKAGAGKDTILQRLMGEAYADERFNEIISCTTRPPREGEIDGVNYYFVTEEEFTHLVLTSQMLEATCFNRWYYGTPISSVNSEKINIGVFNPAGLAALLDDARLAVLPIHIYTDDKTRLLRQLNREKQPNVKEICRRFFADEDDFEKLYMTLDDPDCLMYGVDNSFNADHTAELVYSIIDGVFGQNQ